MIATTATKSFPESWDAPVAGDATFMFDAMHFPYACTPLTNSATGAALAVGFTRAAREYNAPIAQVYVITRNLYHFEHYEMFQPANEDEARKMGELAEATIKPEIGRLLDRWNQEHLPAIQAHLSSLRAMSIETASDIRLAEYLDEIAAIHGELWTIHFRIAIPMLMGLQIFDEFYLDVFGGEMGDGHVLLTGVSSESVKAGLGLYDLAVKARELGLMDTIRDGKPSQLPEILNESEAGRSFLVDFQEYLGTYGYRQDLFELSTPTWLEDPTIALSNIKSYLVSDRDEHQEYAAIQSRAESALTAANASIAMYPEAVQGQFAGMVQIARAASFLQEEHNFYIDQMAESTIRLTYLRIANRLVAAGILEQPDDIFLLEIEEIRSLLENPGSATNVAPVRDLVQTRRMHLLQARTMTPPPFIGPPPQGPPPDSNPMERALGRFFGGPPQQSEQSNQIKGNAGSRGLITGSAFVAMTLEEATGVQPGQILVAVTTMPAWTPLFGVAAAVVTETGGPLSHCAIVAREYGIPAVVGAHGATHRIKTGQTITVDGGSGIVTIGDE